MKHIKPYKIFEGKESEPQHPGFPKTEEEIHRLCIKFRIINYTINEDLSIDVDGSVYIEDDNLKYIPLNFNYVNGDFKCNSNKLITLEGASKEVGGHFSCSYNKLTSLEGSPSQVGGDFNCEGNKLTTLKGGPVKVKGRFGCTGNILKTLIGSPKEVGISFFCGYNKLESLKGISEKINGSLDCKMNKLASLYHLPEGVDYTVSSFQNNPIYSLVNTFIDNDNTEQLVQEFNDYDIVRGDEVVLGRLKAFINDFDLEMPNLELIKENYEIV